MVKRFVVAAALTSMAACAGTETGTDAETPSASSEAETPTGNAPTPTPTDPVDPIDPVEPVEEPCTPRASLLGGPCRDDFDAALEAKATRFDRGFHGIHAQAFGINTETHIRPEKRSAVEAFLDDEGAWDFEASTGEALEDVATSWRLHTALYGGIGIAADAYRYGVLRDENYPSADVDRARAHLLRGLDAMFISHAITGVRGVFARGVMRKSDAPGVVTTPLFDNDGAPLPSEKDNGTWRDDNSIGGLYPDLIWLDSISRDYILGWVMALGAAWEVVANDPAVSESYRTQLTDLASALGDVMTAPGSFGYDLELTDADGRITFHGYLHERNFDGTYIPIGSVKNGLHAVMASGIIATLASVTGDATLRTYLHDELLGERDLAEVVEDYLVVDFGPQTNFSGYNMAFLGLWLVARYLEPGDAYESMRDSALSELYDRADGVITPQPVGWKQSFFDFTYAAIRARMSVHGGPRETTDETIVGYGVETLWDYPAAPYWNDPVENCDADEISSQVCTLNNGETVVLLGEVGWNDELVAATPLPMSQRPASNYHWRSNPYRVNAGGGGELLSAVDFRISYWLARWVD